MKFEKVQAVDKKRYGSNYQLSCMTENLDDYNLIREVLFHAAINISRWQRTTKKQVKELKNSMPAEIDGVGWIVTPVKTELLMRLLEPYIKDTWADDPLPYSEELRNIKLAYEVRDQYQEAKQPGSSGLSPGGSGDGFVG